MEIEGYEINDIDDVLLYDNIDEIYCRCCFKIFLPSEIRVELNNEFLNVIRTLFRLPMYFKEGSRHICVTCNDTVMNFWKFKHEIVDKQWKFSKMVSSKVQRNITKIKSLSPALQPTKVNQPVVHRQEEVFIKEEPNDNEIFNSIFMKEPVPEIKNEEELESPATKSTTIDENQEANLPPPTKKRKVLVKMHVPQKKLPLKTVVKSSGNQEQFFVIPPIPKYPKRCSTCGNMYLDLLSHRIRKHGFVFNFRCSGCDYQSTERKKVVQHIGYIHKKQHGRERKFCEICKKNFIFLESHIENIHKGIKYYFCDLCDFSSYTKYSIKCHMLSSHLPKGTKCPQCDFRTINTVRLKNHFKSQHESIDKASEYFKKRKELVNCPHCDKVLKGSFNLSEHIKRVHEHDLRFKCESPNCSKVFFTTIERQIHFNNSHGPKNFICEICGSGYGSEQMLKAHKKIHADFDFICELCSTKFKSLKNLTLHINRMHVSDKNFKCDQPKCTASFYYQIDLKKHVKASHSGIKFDCEVPGCKSSLGRSDAYRAHLKKSHKELRADEIDKFVKRSQKLVDEKIKMLND